jgi:ribosomal protein S18 acetylase RimI-like enzyme
MPFASRTRLRCATVEDARAIAELIAIAGEGIPIWVWREEAEDGRDPLSVGAERAARPDSMFSYRNAILAEHDGEVAGMMLGFRVDQPTGRNWAALAAVPSPLRPIVELEYRVPGAFYINALAVFERFRDLGIGTRLLQAAASRATALGCTRLAHQVFSGNRAAVRLYERNGFRQVDSRPIEPHPGHSLDGRVLLMVRPL